MTLGKKLFLGFLIPVLMLVASGIWSYARFESLSHRVEAMLEENDRSIQAAVTMTEALERMDSAALMRIVGEPEHAGEVLTQADTLFQNALNTALGNITIDTEPTILDTLQQRYNVYRKELSASEFDKSFDTYRSRVLPAFLSTKHAVDHLRRENAAHMYNQAIFIGHQAYRATLPGTILVVAAVLFTALFAWLIRVHALLPLNRMLRAIEQWPATGHYRSPEVETGDEIQKLSEALELVERTFQGGKRS